MILYTRNACRACVSVKALLKRKGIPFKEVNIEEDYDSALQLVAEGFRSVPVLYDQEQAAFHVGAAAIEAAVA